MNRLSLRTRLLLALGVVAVVALVVIDLAVYTQLRSSLYAQVDATLDASHRAVEQSVEPGGGQSSPEPGPGPPVAGGPARGQSTPGQDESPTSGFCAQGRASAPGMFIEVRSAAGSVVDGEECPAYAAGGKGYTPALPGRIIGYVPDPNDFGEPTAYLTVGSTTPGGPAFRVRASELNGGGMLIVADPVSDVEATLRHLLHVELLVSGAALLGALALGLWLVHLGLRPLRDVVGTAEAITAGDLDRRVPNENERTEVGRVATAFNLMLERIQAAIRELQASQARLRRFVSDASHELRTPVAAVSAYAQLFRRGAADREQDLGRVMAGIERESARMGRLVEDLLLLARLDEPEGLEAEPVELVGLVAEAIETARTVGPSWPIAFVATVAIEVRGDRASLRQVIDNLLGNVRAHTPPGTKVSVRVARLGPEAVVEVADDGPGIAPEQLPMLFERFFRADPSRSRETGGAGLGLAIVATIVRAHGGRAEAEAAGTGGALFRIVLPALEPPLEAE